MAKIDGVKVVLGGEEFIIPPLNIKGLRKLGPKMKMLESISDGDLPSDEEYVLILEVCQLALQRNYPEITQEKLEEIIDLNNMFAVLGAVMSASGFQANFKQPETGGPTTGEG